MPASLFCSCCGVFGAKNKFTIKVPNNKEFRVSVERINSRIKNEFGNIKEIITIVNPDKKKGRNKYKWKIDFE